MQSTAQSTNFGGAAAARKDNLTQWKEICRDTPLLVARRRQDVVSNGESLEAVEEANKDLMSKLARSEDMLRSLELAKAKFEKQQQQGHGDGRATAAASASDAVSSLGEGTIEQVIREAFHLDLTDPDDEDILLEATNLDEWFATPRMRSIINATLAKDENALNRPTFELAEDMQQPPEVDLDVRNFMRRVAADERRRLGQPSVISKPSPYVPGQFHWPEKPQVTSPPQQEELKPRRRAWREGEPAANEGESMPSDGRSEDEVEEEHAAISAEVSGVSSHKSGEWRWWEAAQWQ